MAESYEIGIRLLMSGNVAEALGLLSSGLTGIHGQVRDVEKSLSNWHGLIISASVAFAGIELGKGIKDVVEHGAKLEHFEAQAKAAGLTVAEQGAAIGAAWKNVGSNINASVTESLKNILELRQATGSVDEAIRMLPAFTRTEMALGSLKDDDLKGQVGGTQRTYDFARALEQLAVTQDEKKLDSYIATMTREIIGMRGLVDGSKLYQGITNAGGARYAWNEDFVGRVLGPLLNESMRNGFGLFQLDRSFGAGVMTEMMAQGAEKYGLFNKKDEYRDAHGRWKGMQAGSIAGYDELRANPEAWALDVALPLLKSHGVDIDDTNAMSKAITEISRGNKNLNTILDALLLPANRKYLAKERANIDRVPDDAATVLQKNDPALAMDAFNKSWDNLLTSLGKPVVADAAAAIRSLASGIDSLATTIAAHPDITKIGVEMASAAAGLMALGGSIMVIKYALAIGRGASLLAAAGGAAAASTAAGGATETAAVGAAGAAAVSRGLLSRLGIIGAVIAATEWLDPKGDFGGLTSPIDNWFKSHLGFDPSNIRLPAPSGLDPNQMTPWGRAGVIHRGDLPYMSGGPNAANLFGIGNEHVVGAPPTQTTLNLTTNLSVDGRTLASVVEKYIVAGNQFIKGPSAFDGRAMPEPIDHGLQGHL
jgi:hypothetical protein